MSISNLQRLTERQTQFYHLSFSRYKVPLMALANLYAFTQRQCYFFYPNMRVLGSSLFILFKAESKNPLQVSACFQLIAQYSHLTENCMCGRITSGDNVHLLQMWQNLIRSAVRQKYKGEDLYTLQSTTLRFQDQFHTYFTILPLKKFSKANVQK